MDQGQEGSCTAHAGLGAFQYLLKNQKSLAFVGSRNFLYYAERRIDGDTSKDAGSTSLSCSKALSRYGVCLETLWPYSQTDMLKNPPAPLWQEALTNKISSYKALTTLSQLKACLASGVPFIFGINVYQSFEDATDGIIPMPVLYDSLEGGHELCVVGYDDTKNWFIVRNSWGKNWGSNGYCYISYAYISKYAADFMQFIL